MSCTDHRPDSVHAQIISTVSSEVHKGSQLVFLSGQMVAHVIICIIEANVKVIICVWYVWMGVCISTNVLRHHSLLWTRSTCRVLKVSVSILLAGTHCARPPRARQSFGLMPALWQHPGPNLALFSPLQKRWLFGTHRRKKKKPFQQLSVCFGCEKSSWRITLKSMPACDTLKCTQLYSELTTPRLFPVPLQGCNIKSGLITVWPLNYWLRRAAGAVQNSTADYERKKRLDWTMKESHIWVCCYPVGSQV